MTRMDRFLAREFILFSLLGLLSVVVIYDLINLIEKMSYFLRYKAGVVEILTYYAYDLPATVGLLLPVGFALGVFLVIGRMIRSNELLPLQASGVDLYRLFAVFGMVAGVVAALAFLETEFVATRARTAFIDYKKEHIEGRRAIRSGIHNRVFYISAEGTVYYIRQLRVRDSTARDWVIWKLGDKRDIRRSIRIETARYTREGGWTGEDVEIRDFSGSQARFLSFPRRPLSEVTETPAELGVRSRETSEMPVGELWTYIQRMQMAGSNVAVEMVDFHSRFCSPLIILIVTVISLSAATLLRKGNITLGIGLGLLLSFVYWGAIQASRSFGYAGAFPPWLAAWLPNLLFLAVSGVLLTKVKR